MIAHPQFLKMLRKRIYWNRLWISVLFLLTSCSSPSEFTPYAETSTLRREIQTLKIQWISEKCPSKASRAQCDDIFQRGISHCIGKSPSQKARCIYNELYCTLYGGDACRF